MRALVVVSIIVMSVGLLLGGWTMVSSWGDQYAVAVKTASGWSLQEGGRGGWMLLFAGSLIGLVLGGVAGVLTGSRLWEMLGRHEDEQLALRRAEVGREAERLSVERGELLARIETARHEGIEIAFKKAWERENALIAAQRLVRSSEERIKRLEGQLKGAQGRANRKTKKKPSAVPKGDEIGNYLARIGG